MQIYGGAAQDFGSGATGKPNWESYGWSLFKLQNMPIEHDDIKIQVRSKWLGHLQPRPLILGQVVNGPCQGLSDVRMLWILSRLHQPIASHAPAWHTSTAV